MQSTRPVEPLDSFEIDVPITASDCEAQWQLRLSRRLSSEEYLAWCSWLTRDSVVPARDFHTQPFEL